MVMHTPGPWTFVRTETGFRIDAGEQQVVIADCTDHEVSDADARLMEMAPTLLAALAVRVDSREPMTDAELFHRLAVRIWKSVRDHYDSPLPLPPREFLVHFVECDSCSTGCGCCGGACRDMRRRKEEG